MIDATTRERYDAVKRLVDDLQAWPSADTVERLRAKAVAGGAASAVLAPGFDKVRAAAGILLAPGRACDPLWTSLFDAIDELDALMRVTCAKAIGGVAAA